MTKFRKHDRVRIIDDTPVRGLLGSFKPSTFALKAGADTPFVTHVSTPEGLKLRFEGSDTWWNVNRFELVERAVAEDRDGRPLYAGDVVSVVAGDAGGAIYCDVMADQSDSVSVRVQNRGAVYTTPCRDVTLAHRHWDAEAGHETPDVSAAPTDAEAKLTEAVERLNKTMQEYRKIEMVRFADAADLLNSALRKVLETPQLGRPEEGKK